jgi:drug/metabolite transporter (DMT)-like permease
LTTSPQAKATGYQHINARTAGYLLALGSAAAISATYIFRKVVSDQVSPATFSIWWYGLAGIYAWVLALARGEAYQARSLRQGWQPVMALVLANAAGAILYYTEIDLTNPALVSFFGRLRTIYIVLLGALFFAERLNGREWLGAVVAVAGTMLIAYRGGQVLSTVFFLALIENLLMAVATIMAKVAVRGIPPIVLTAYRGVLIPIAILPYALLTGQWEPVHVQTLAIIALGACSGPFLGHVMRYAALERLDAGKAAIVYAIQPVFVTVYAALLFGDVPTVQQFLGGALAIGGVILVFLAQQREQGGLERADE